jgi:hypothetical protein
MPGIPQLVAERMDGKRPGYRGDAAYSSGSEQSKTSAGGQGNVGSQSSFGDGPSGPSVSPGGDRNDNNITMEILDPVDMPGLYTKDDIEFYPTTIKGPPSVFDFVTPPGVYSPTNTMFKNMQTLDRFTKYRPDVKVPQYGLMKLLEGPMQAFSDFTTAKNRDFFQDVIRAGKIPGMNFATLSDMSDQQLEDVYQDYMSNRLAGKTDAYGNPLPQSDDDSNPLQNLLLAQQLANPTVDQEENLQGGVAQLYNQYLQNLGSL